MKDYLPFGHRPISDRPGLLQSAGLFAIRKHLPGGYRLMDTLYHRGGLRPVRWHIKNEVSVIAPVLKGEYWDLQSLESYEIDLMKSLARRIGNDSYFLVDCGADFGLFPFLLRAQGVQISRLVAFEPNPISYRWCLENLKQFGDVHNVAVADFSGRASLRSPVGQPDPQSRFIERDEQGDVRVMRIDDVGLHQPRVLIKLDIEGGELAALQGARQTLSEAEQVIVAFEAHAEVAARTKIPASAIMRHLNSIRRFECTVAECPDLHGLRPETIDAAIGNRRTSNIVAWSA